MLQAHSITRCFGSTVALDAVDFIGRRGEIHALLGENGAGKTTLMNVLAGVITPHGGTVSLDGAPLHAGSPHAALDAGIAAVHQSSMLFERMTWEENLALGGFAADSWRTDLELVSRLARRQADDLGFDLPAPGTRVEDLSVAQRVRMEILRALSFRPQVLILDEPTSVLGPQEISAFFDLLRRLRDERRIIVTITHKLDEALAVADRVSVLRDGRMVESSPASETSQTRLARAMIGDLPPAGELQPPSGDGGPSALEVRDLVFVRDGHRVLNGLSLSVTAGEVVGIAGVDGNGQRELVEILAGVLKPSQGRVIRARPRSADPASTPIAVIPQDRDLDGLILDMELWENVVLEPAVRRHLTRRGWLGRGAAMALTARLIERFRVKAPGPRTLMRELSGGNRQRLEVARAIASAPSLLVAHNVCRGLDLRAAGEVHRALLDYARDGGAVLLISNDLDELLAMCGKLLVLTRGRLIETRPADRNPERLGTLMAGADA